MKCWRCGKEIENGVSRCIYCQSDQDRPEPVSDVGLALRLLYDRYGSEAVLTNPALLANGLGDVIPDTLSVNVKKLKNILKMVMDAGIGRLYLERLTEGNPNEAFDTRVKTILTEDTGFSEQTADELTVWFDEMIGWKGLGSGTDDLTASKSDETDAFSLFLLGYMNEMGYDTPPSDKKALMYYQQAAEMGLSAAEFLLGLKYENGDSVEKSVPAAIDYYRKAAASGCEIALNKVKKLESETAASVGNPDVLKMTPGALSNEPAVGSLIRFGRFDQNGDGSAEIIEWQILAVESCRALILSKFGLGMRPYNDFIVFSEKTTWETSDLRNWLNSEFYDTAFNSAEKSKILEVRNSNPDTSEFMTKGGNDTMDRVFLLSIDEIKKYLPSSESRLCKAADTEQCTWWWLRSPGDESSSAAIVNFMGNIHSIGYFVDISGTVRPALWINL